MAEKTIAILDTETTMYSQIPFNVAYIIVNQKGYVIHKREFLFKDIMEFEHPFYPYKHLPLAEITKSWLAVEELVADFDKYNVGTVCAYNAKFDTRVLQKLEIDLEENYKVVDLWAGSVQAFCLTTDFIQWAVENEKLTEKGNIKTSAEVIYQYLSGLENFVEAHTALADCEIELEIFREIQRTIGIDEVEQDAQPWRTVKEYREG